MRRLRIIGVLIISLIFPNFVKADTFQYEIITNSNNSYTEKNYINTNNYICTNKTNCSFEEAYNEIWNYYITNKQSNYNYWTIQIRRNTDYKLSLSLTYSNNNNIELGYNTPNENSSTYSGIVTNGGTIYYNSGLQIEDGPNSRIVYIITNEAFSINEPMETWYAYYDSNINLESTVNVELSNFYNNTDIIIEENDTIPKIKDLIEYNSWSDYENNHLDNYTTINLDNYYYVLLNLKDYNQNEAFSTNLQVKGQIGITPIYNYGQTTKDAVTGVKVQDRCNLEYQNYTRMQLYILKQDIQNNVIYAVKKCSNGSSFKFDNTIFDITYITDANKDDPVVTIEGKQYHTIPFDDLPSTANKNEEENYIPGESGSANSEGGLSGALKGIQQKMSEIWDIITFFSGFVNTMFSILPEPIRIILLSAFAIAITLGLIKIFIN